MKNICPILTDYTIFAKKKLGKGFLRKDIFFLISPSLFIEQLRSQFLTRAFEVRKLIANFGSTAFGLLGKVKSFEVEIEVSQKGAEQDNKTCLEIWGKRCIFYLYLYDIMSYFFLFLISAGGSVSSSLRLLQMVKNRTNWR